jgi:uncharacterized protein YciI
VSGEDLTAPPVIAQYVMVLYHRADPGLAQGDPEEVFGGHMAFLNRLSAEGMNLLSGPFGDDAPLRGISIYNTDSVETIEALVATDPAVVFGHLRAEVRPWYGVPGSGLPPV